MRAVVPDRSDGFPGEAAVSRTRATGDAVRVPRMPKVPHPVDPIAPVIARMEAIGSGLKPADGVACFNHLYLAVTKAVDGRVATAGFVDPAFLSALDVTFAKLYFKAVGAAPAGRKPSRAWRPLFEQRRRQRIAPIQFALAGMNAHIN